MTTPSSDRPDWWADAAAQSIAWDATATLIAACPGCARMRVAGEPPYVCGPHLEATDALYTEHRSRLLAVAGAPS